MRECRFFYAYIRLFRHTTTNREEIQILIIVDGVNEDARREDKNKFYGELHTVIDQRDHKLIIMSDIHGRLVN